MEIHLFTPIPKNKTPLRALFERAGRICIILVFFLSLMGGPSITVNAASTITFTGEEFLSRPTATSININVIPASAIQLYYDYSTVSGGTYLSTQTVSAAAATPCNVVISGLTPDTKYYYHLHYHVAGETDWVTRTEHSFHTQRATGDTFTFVVTSDTHAGLSGNFYNTTRYNQTLNHILADHPDFWIDTGDTPKDDFLHSLTEYQNGYKALRGLIKAVSGDVPFFQVLGNHEQEMGWNLDDEIDPYDTQPIQAVNARRAIFPNPKPDGFYSGNLDASLTYIDDDHLREDYYAWTWGDAQFIALDPYWYTMKFPQENSTYPFGGEENQGGENATKGTRWDWSLGIEQYLWLKNTLATSTSTYKFVFIHNVTGGIIPYGRGGAEIAGYFEWGGKNWDGTEGFADHRPAASGWTLPIHQLMDQYNVTIFFHGHDHFYAKQDLDGIVYQEIPMPAGADGYAGFRDEQTGTYASQYPDPADILYYDGATKYPDSGHLRVTVSPTGVTVDYVDMVDGSITATYTIPAPAPSGKSPSDFDGDGRSDPVKYDSSAHTVSWLKSSDGTWDSADMGTDTFNYVPRSDFDGDGQADPAKFVPSVGAVWYLKSGSASWEGQFVGSDLYTYVSGADYDGDGMTDPTKFLSDVNALWYLQSSSSTWEGVYMGPGSFTLVNGSDYDGDGQTDPALFVSSVNALWYQESSSATWKGLYMGPGSYEMVPASDFDGDGKTDPAQFDSSSQVLWYQGSSSSTWEGVYMGTGTYDYVSGCDFDGDGKTDPAKFDPGTHVLWYLKSSTGTWQGVWMGDGTYDIVN